MRETVQEILNVITEEVDYPGDVDTRFRALMRASRIAKDAINKADAGRAPPHPDDIAVDRMAAAMKEKLAKKRAEGRGGWEDKEQCTHEQLSCMLVDHIQKGDPVDVANFAMMLHNRGERITGDGTFNLSADIIGSVREVLTTSLGDILYLANEYDKTARFKDTTSAIEEVLRSLPELPDPCGDKCSKDEDCSNFMVTWHFAETPATSDRAPPTGCESCDDFGRVELLPQEDPLYAADLTHPCEDCQPQAAAHYRSGFEHAERIAGARTGGVLERLRIASIKRQQDWPGNRPDLISLSYRATELGGETGEALNVIKKIERERLGLAGSRASITQLAAELADVIICADLIAEMEGINLSKAVVDKFNQTSRSIPQLRSFEEYTTSPDQEQQA